MHHTTIILVHYNTPQQTITCLESLQSIEQSADEVSILVVDNGSTQALSLPSREWRISPKVVRTPANLGFTGGNNLGIVEARTLFNPDSVLLLNTDTTVAPDFLSKLRDVLTDTSVGGVCPKIYFTAGQEFHTQSYSETQKGSVFWYAGGVLDWGNLETYHRHVDEVDRSQADLLCETDFLTGCALLIPRKIIEEVGLLNKKYFLYYEDCEYSLRVKQAGYKLIYQPQAVVWHDNAGSSGGAGSSFQEYYQTRNRLALSFKFGPLRARLRALKLWWKMLKSGNKAQRKAALDIILFRYGKQPIA